MLDARLMSGRAYVRPGDSREFEHSRAGHLPITPKERTI